MCKRLIYLPCQRCSLFVAACAGLLIAIPALRAQSPTVSRPGVANAQVPAYDVVSIKPNKTGSGNSGVSMDGGNFAAENVSLKTMVLSAWGLKDPQLLNLPRWGDSARFDIKAKIIDPDRKTLAALAPEQFRAMQRPMLTDRFQLTFHRGKKVLPIYDLVVLKGGPRFKEATAAEIIRPGTSINNGKLIGTGLTLSSLADSLSGQVQRIVVDKTGLPGKYDVQLSWASDESSSPAPDSAAPPDIFTALQEQLGLKLQPDKAEIETFVIDHAELPSEN